MRYHTIFSLLFLLTGYIGLDAVEGVSCGCHDAPSCGQCGTQAYMCNGDCTWTDDGCVGDEGPVGEECEMDGVVTPEVGSCNCGSAGNCFEGQTCFLEGGYPSSCELLDFDGPVFTSSGASGKLFGQSMKFKMMSKQENGFPVFIGTGGFFLYVLSFDGGIFWVIGTLFGDESKIIMKSTELPVLGSIPTHGWLYYDGGAWKMDSYLISVSIPTGGFSMEFSSTDFAASFSVKMIGLEFNGFPVAMTSNGDFFFVIDMGEGLVWAVGSILGDISSVWMISSGTKLPTFTIPSVGWKYFIEGAWVEAVGLVSLPMSGFDISFESTGAANMSLSLPISFKRINVQLNGFDVFMGSNGSFLFVNGNSNWVVGTTMGDDATVFMQNLETASTAVPSFFWQYREEKAITGAWLDDSDLVAKPLKGHDGPVFMSTGPAGDFSIKFSMTDKLENGFPVFIGTGGYFLFVALDTVNALAWHIGTHIGDTSKGLLLISTEKPPVLGSIPTSGWTYSVGGAWQLDETLISAAIPTGDFDGPVFTSSGASGQLFDMSMKFKNMSMQENGFPVFIGTGGFFLYVASIDDGLFWVIGPLIGDVSMIIMKSTETPVEGLMPTLGWLYFDGGDWKMDSYLISVAIPTGGFNMEFISSDIAASFAVKLILLEFNGFPVAITSNGYFFFVMDMGEGLVWVVGAVLGDMSTVWMKHSSTELPSFTIPSIGWTYFIDGAWTEAVGLVSIPMTGFDISFESTGAANISLSLPISFKRINVINNGFDVFIGSNGSFLFVNGNSNWVVGTKMGDDSTVFMQHTETATNALPSFGWKYREGKTISGPWWDDPELVAKPLKGHDGPVFMSTGPAGKLFDFSMKFIMTSKLENGFPVFIGTGGFFLFVAFDGDNALAWHIGTHIGNIIGKIILVSTEKPPVLGSVPTSGWTYWDGGAFVADEDLISVAIPTGGVDKEFSSTGPEKFLLPLPFSVKLIDLEFNGFHVAITTDGDFLFKMDMGEGLVWVVGSVLGDIKSVWIMHSLSSSDTTLPRNGWMILLDGMWIEAFGLETETVTDLIVTGGDSVGGPIYSSEIIFSRGVCNSTIPNIPEVVDSGISGGSSVWINGTLVFCGGSNVFIGATGAFAEWTSSKTCYSLKPNQTEWSTSQLCGPTGCDASHKNDMEFGRSWFSLTRVNDEEMIAIGGLSLRNDNVLKTMEKWSTTSYTWTTLVTELADPRFGHCTVQNSTDTVIIIGGSFAIDYDAETWTPTNTVIQINPETGDSEDLDNLPVALWGHACSVLPGYIYVSGGSTGSVDAVQGDVYRYSFSTKTWSSLIGTLKQARWGHVMGIPCHNHLVVAGGYDPANAKFAVNSIERSHGNLQSWTEKNESHDGAKRLVSVMETNHAILGQNWTEGPLELSAASGPAMAEVPAGTFGCDSIQA